MDSITQIVLGAACGEAVLGKKIGNKALLWGAVGGTIPDLDVLLNPFFNSVDGLFVHRGYSHSLLFAFMIAPLLGLLLHRFSKNKTVSKIEWTKLFFWSLFTHPLLDAFTGYGTPLFLPFSNYRIDINSIFIVDPLYTLPFAFCLIMIIIARRNISKRKKWNYTGIAISSIYLLFTVINQYSTKTKFDNELQLLGVKTNRSMSFPTPFNNILWCHLAETDTGYFVGYRSMLDKKQTIDFTFFPNHRNLINAFAEDNQLQKLIKFSKGYYIITSEDGKLYFNDIRFGQMGGWDNKQASFVFKFLLEPQADGTLKISNDDWRKARMSGLSSLWQRIKGI